MSEKASAPLADRLTLTVPEAAALSGIPVKVVRAAVVCDELASFTAGSTTRRIKRADLDGWVGML